MFNRSISSLRLRLSTPFKLAPMSAKNSRVASAGQYLRPKSWSLDKSSSKAVLLGALDTLDIWTNSFAHLLLLPPGGPGVHRLHKSEDDDDGFNASRDIIFAPPRYSSETTTMLLLPSSFSLLPSDAAADDECIAIIIIIIFFDDDALDDDDDDDLCRPGR